MCVYTAQIQKAAPYQYMRISAAQNVNKATCLKSPLVFLDRLTCVQNIDNTYIIQDYAMQVNSGAHKLGTAMKVHCIHYIKTSSNLSIYPVCLFDK